MAGPRRCIGQVGKGEKKEGVPPVLVGLDWVGTWFLSILDPVAKLSLRVRPGRGGGATGDGANESGHGSCKREMQLELGEKRARGGDGRKLGNWVRSGGGGGGLVCWSWDGKGMGLSVEVGFSSFLKRIE